MPWRRAAACCVAASCVLAACGGDSGGPSAALSGAQRQSTSSTSPETPSTATTVATPTPGPTTVAPAVPTPATTTAPAPTANPCAVGPQSPPTDSISANFPTALAFAPDGRLFWAERSGTVRVWQDGEARTFATVNTVTTEAGGGYSERGLLGLAVSPSFSRDRFVYAFYSNTNRATQTVVRWTDCGGSGSDATNLIELPAGSTCCHKGGRLAFGPDGKLFVTLGDQHSSAAAQDTSDERGKVLRYNADGSIPADNPFGADNPVWAFGFRNPFGLAVSPSGQVAVTDNGPTGDAGSPGTGYDRVIANVVRGGGYQWPRCYGYSHPNTSSDCGEGQHPPDWSSESSTVVPTGATFVDAGGPAPYAGRLVFCATNGGMRILTPGSPNATVTSGPAACQLDVKQGPDRALYVSSTSAIQRIG